MTSRNNLTFSPALPQGRGTLAPLGVTVLHPRQPLQLAVTQGQLWLTLTGPHAQYGNEMGDVFLAAGQALCLPAGQQVVLEAMGRQGDESTCFHWAAAPAGHTPWQQHVAWPFADLVHALRSAANAAGRLASGVLRLVWGRGAVAPCIAGAGTLLGSQKPF